MVKMPNLKSRVTYLNLGLAILGWTMGVMKLIGGDTAVDVFAWSAVGVVATLFLVGVGKN